MHGVDGVADEIAYDLPNLTLKAHDFSSVAGTGISTLTLELMIFPWRMVQNFANWRSQVTADGFVVCL